jgi:hypothetical protein
VELPSANRPPRLRLRGGFAFSGGIREKRRVSGLPFGILDCYIAVTERRPELKIYRGVEQP